MSRIGRKPIIIVEGVTVAVIANTVTVKGPKGELKQEFSAFVKISKEENNIVIKPATEGNVDKKISAYWGMARKSIQNMVDGVSKGFEKNLIIQGVGFKSQLNGQTLVLNLGYTHPVKMEIPPDLKIEVKNNVNITVSGIDRYKVGQFSALIRDKKRPEPYKGKGIRYSDERVKRKVGKTGV